VTLSVRALAAVLASAAVLAACVPTPGRDDGGVPPSDRVASGASARVYLPTEVIEIGDVTVTALVLRIASLRLVSDRGVALDPVRTDVGSVDIASPVTLEFASIPPASYSAAVFVLDGAAATLEIEADDAVLGPVHVSYGSRIEWMARCSSGVPVGVGETLAVRVDAELTSAWEDLRAADLPDPDGGVVNVDETTAPAAVRALVLAIGDAIRAECDLDTP
jgi:hypothetical protein